MRIKKLLVLGLSVAMAMGVMTGCSTDKPAPKDEQKTETSKQEEKTEEKVEEKNEEKTEGEAEIVIPVVSKGFQHQFWQAVKMGAEQAAEELGVSITFEGPETEDQIDKQLEMLQAALAKNPQAICLAALDSKAATPYLEQADAAGIPVIGFDSGVDSPICKNNVCYR